MEWLQSGNQPVGWLQFRDYVVGKLGNQALINRGGGSPNNYAVESVLGNATTMMKIDDALQRLNNKLNLLAAAAGIAAAVAPDKILPFMYAHSVYVIIYLVVGVAPLQEFIHPCETLKEMGKDWGLGIVWGLKFVALWCLVFWSGHLLIYHQPETAIEIHGGETLKYIPLHSPPAGSVPMLYLGHNQKFFISCGVFGEQGTPVLVKDSTATCP
jgi:hypothetical protein